MAEEEKQNVDELAGKDGKHPETVSWTQYVGIKEKFNRVESELKGKVQTLEEQIAKANPEEFKRVKAELDDIKPKFQQTSTELKSLKDKSVSEKREILKTRGVPEDKLKDVSEKELDTLISVLGDVKPKPGADLGSGGGSGSLPNDPLTLFRMAKTKTK